MQRLLKVCRETVSHAHTHIFAVCCTVLRCVAVVVAVVKMCRDC